MVVEVDILHLDVHLVLDHPDLGSQENLGLGHLDRESLGLDLGQGNRGAGLGHLDRESLDLDLGQGIQDADLGHLDLGSQAYQGNRDLAPLDYHQGT